MFKLDLEEPEEPDVKLPVPAGSSKKQKSFKKKKKSTSGLLIMPKPLCKAQPSMENSSRWEYQTTWPASWELCMQVKKYWIPNWERSTSSLFIVTLLI